MKKLKWIPSFRLGVHDVSIKCPLDLKSSDRLGMIAIRLLLKRPLQRPSK